MARKDTRKKRFVVCVRNTGYPVALELRKIYQALPDANAEAHGLVRVIDESGEDYLYPDKFFVGVDLPHPLQNALRRAAGGSSRALARSPLRRRLTRKQWIEKG